MKETSPLKAIRQHCLDCSCGSYTEVKLCTVLQCALHAFRFGTNPHLKRELTDEQRAELAERAANARLEKENRKKETSSESHAGENEGGELQSIAA